MRSINTMRSISLAASLAAAALLLLSCASSGRPYYLELAPPARLEGKAVLASCQLKRQAIKSSGILGSLSRTTYTLSWTDANPLMDALGKHLPAAALSAIPVQIFPDSYYSSMRRARNSSTSVRTAKTVAATGFVPLYDASGDPSRLDPSLIDILAASSGADLFVVIDGDIIDAVSPTLTNFMEFSLVYELSLIVYRRDGAKVLSRHYRKGFQRLDPGLWRDDMLYIDLLEETAAACAPEMVKDIAAFFPQNDAAPADLFNISI